MGCCGVAVAKAVTSRSTTTFERERCCGVRLQRQKIAEGKFGATTHDPRETKVFAVELCKPCKPLALRYGCPPRSTQPPLPHLYPAPSTPGTCEWGRKGAPYRQTTRRSSACGCYHTPRVHSGLPPREDHASNLVGSLRDTIGRRWFRAVCGIGLEMDEGAGHAMFLCSYSTCTGPRRLAQGPRSRGARSALTFCRSNDRARAARVSEAV